MEQNTGSRLSLDDRMKIRVSDWISVSSGDVDRSEIPYDKLKKLGIRVGELGILGFGAPPQLLELLPPRLPHNICQRKRVVSV